MGAKGIELSKKHPDEIKIKTSLGEITDKIPFTYEWVQGLKNRRTANWKKISENLIGLQVDEWNPKNKLVIDPIPMLVWGTYYGGANKEI